MFELCLKKQDPFLVSRRRYSVFSRLPQGVFGFERIAFIDGIGALTSPIVCQGTPLDQWFPKASSDRLLWSLSQGRRTHPDAGCLGGIRLMLGFQRQMQCLLGETFFAVQEKRQSVLQGSMPCWH